MQTPLFTIKLFYLTMTLLAITLWTYTAEEYAEKVLWLMLVFSVGVEVGVQVGV